MGYEDIKGRFGGELDGGVITGCAEDLGALGWIVLFANEGDLVVALPGKCGGLASACSCGEEAADVEIYSLGATSAAFALSST